MNITTELVLRTIIMLGTWSPDSPELKAIALEPVAAAIAAVAAESQDPRTSAARLITVGKHESQFAVYVVEERCEQGPPGARCDMDAKGIVHATSVYQLHRWALKAWDPEVTLGARIIEATRYADQRLRMFAETCKTHHPGNPHAAALAGYGTGDCTSGNGVRRAKTTTLVLQYMQIVERQITKERHDP